jgi:hypothetical protein
MNTILRPAALVFSFALLVNLSPPLCASSVDDNLLTSQAITQLEARAQQAKPREQCFLYTELVHNMTELAGKQMLAGDVDQASATLKKVEHYAELIHLNLANDTKRLKNAEMLMHHTTYRLGEYLHQASSEDQVTLKATLKQLDQIQDEILNQVFKK